MPIRYLVRTAQGKPEIAKGDEGLSLPTSDWSLVISRNARAPSRRGSTPYDGVKVRPWSSGARSAFWLVPVLATGPYAAKSFAMRSRILASGIGPSPACRLSFMWFTREVAGMTHVTAGCEAMNLRKNCAQLAQPISAA